MFVADLADDLLENVLARDQPRRAPELVDDDRDVRRRSLKIAELVVERLRLRHKRRRPHQRLPARARLREPHRDGHEILAAHHAADVVGRAVDDRQAGVLALPECVEDFFDGGRNIHARHVETRRHDLNHRRIGQREDAEQHVALRHAARQRIADNEQQDGTDDEGDHGFHPRPCPPRHRVRGRDRTEHEERQARDVECAMQRHAPFGGDRRCVAQGVQRFPDRRFLAERQQRRPHPGADGDDEPDESQCRFGEHQRRSRLT